MKDEKKVENKVESKVESGGEVRDVVALHPDVLAAIQSAVSASVAAIIDQLKPVPAPEPEILPVVPAGTKLPQQATWKSRLQGIPVAPGQDLRHVSRETISAWFNSIENRWKDSYNKKQMAGKPVNVNWTRG